VATISAAPSAREPAENGFRGNPLNRVWPFSRMGAKDLEKWIRRRVRSFRFVGAALAFVGAAALVMTLAGHS
jgi:hypothetical protein